METTFKPGRSISSDIDTLDLGVFADEARDLANTCFRNSDNTDVGKLVYVTGAGKVVIPNQTTQVLKDGPLKLDTISTTPKEIAAENKSDDRYVAMGLFTRENTDMPFSAAGIYRLLVPDSHPGTWTATFIAGRT